MRLEVEVDESTLARIDTFVARLHTQNPGRAFSREDALRSILGQWQSFQVEWERQAEDRAEATRQEHKLEMQREVVEKSYQDNANLKALERANNPADPA